MIPPIVHLVLTHHWFDEMVSGRKDVEYRVCDPHWSKFLWNRRHAITHARFSRGYTKRAILRRILSMDVGPCPYEGWTGAFYRIQLGPIEAEDNPTTGATP